MGRTLIVSFLTACGIYSAVAADKVPPDTVVAVINGKKTTAGELERALSGAPPKMAGQLRADRKGFAESYAMVTLLREMAEKEGLAHKSPYQEQLEWSRMQILMQAAIAERGKPTAADPSPEAAQARLKQWLEQNSRDIKIDVKDESFFSNGTPGDEAKVVAIVDGRQLTGAEVRRLITGTPPSVRENFRTSPKQFLEQYALMARLVADAEAKKLQDKSPYVEQLEWVQSQQLMQAKLNAYSDSISIGPKEEKEYYESHKDQYTEAKVKVLYVSFGTDPGQLKQTAGRKILTEAEAREKIESLRKQVLNGADFVKLVKEHSEDATSAAKDGDLGVIRRSDSLPDHIKQAVFSLKPGQVSEVVKQPNGFYLFRLEQIGTKTPDEVRQDVLRDAKTAKFQEWFDTIRKSATITYENEAYFAAPQGD
jgi:peptidyl-prolyl cis-trans isomerase C